MKKAFLIFIFLFSTITAKENIWRNKKLSVGLWGGWSSSFYNGANALKSYCEHQPITSKCSSSTAGPTGGLDFWLNDVWLTKSLLQFGLSASFVYLARYSRESSKAGALVGNGGSQLAIPIKIEESMNSYYVPITLNIRAQLGLFYASLGGGYAIDLTQYSYSESGKLADVVLEKRHAPVIATMFGVTLPITKYLSVDIGTRFNVYLIKSVTSDKALTLTKNKYMSDTLFSQTQALSATSTTERLEPLYNLQPYIGVYYYY